MKGMVSLPKYRDNIRWIQQKNELNVYRNNKDLILGMRPTTNTIYANIGYAGITSKFYLPSGASGNPKSGLD